jgi:hypothetical protein
MMESIIGSPETIIEAKISLPREISEVLAEKFDNNTHPVEFLLGSRTFKPGEQIIDARERTFGDAIYAAPAEVDRWMRETLMSPTIMKRVNNLFVQFPDCRFLIRGGIRLKVKDGNNSYSSNTVVAQFEFFRSGEGEVNMRIVNNDTLFESGENVHPSYITYAPINRDTDKHELPVVDCEGNLVLRPVVYDIPLVDPPEVEGWVANKTSDIEHKRQEQHEIYTDQLKLAEARFVLLSCEPAQKLLLDFLGEYRKFIVDRSPLYNSDHNSAEMQAIINYLNHGRFGVGDISDLSSMSQKINFRDLPEVLQGLVTHIHDDYLAAPGYSVDLNQNQIGVILLHLFVQEAHWLKLRYNHDDESLANHSFSPFIKNVSTPGEGVVPSFYIKHPGIIDFLKDDPIYSNCSLVNQDGQLISSIHEDGHSGFNNLFNKAIRLQNNTGFRVILSRDQMVGIFELIKIMLGQQESYTFNLYLYDISEDVYEDSSIELDSEVGLDSNVREELLILTNKLLASNQAIAISRLPQLQKLNLTTETQISLKDIFKLIHNWFAVSSVFVSRIREKLIEHHYEYKNETDEVRRDSLRTQIIQDIANILRDSRLESYFSSEEVVNTALSQPSKNKLKQVLDKQFNGVVTVNNQVKLQLVTELAQEVVRVTEQSREQVAPLSQVLNEQVKVIGAGFERREGNGLQYFVRPTFSVMDSSTGIQGTQLNIVPADLPDQNYVYASLSGVAGDAVYHMIASYAGKSDYNYISIDVSELKDEGSIDTIPQLRNIVDGLRVHLSAGSDWHPDMLCLSVSDNPYEIHTSNANQVLESRKRCH